MTDSLRPISTAACHPMPTRDRHTSLEGGFGGVYLGPSATEDPFKRSKSLNEHDKDSAATSFMDHWKVEKGHCEKSPVSKKAKQPSICELLRAIPCWEFVETGCDVQSCLRGRSSLNSNFISYVKLSREESSKSLITCKDTRPAE